MSSAAADPPWVPHVLFFETPHSSGHDPRTTQISNHLLEIIALHDRQTPDIVAQHLRGRLVQSLYQGTPSGVSIRPGYKEFRHG
jgi:hypothetical protein